MATQTETATQTAVQGASTLTLDPPQPLQVVQPEQTAGLVPLKQDQKDQLEEKVDGFVNELVALDSNSPEFGKKVDQLTSMGRKEISEAAGHSNRFLDRPVKAINAGTDLLVFSNVQSGDPDLGVRIHAAIVAAVRDGRIPRARVEQAYGKIMLLKRRLEQKDISGKW